MTWDLMLLRQTVYRYSPSHLLSLVNTVCHYTEFKAKATSILKGNNAGWHNLKSEIHTAVVTQNYKSILAHKFTISIIDI